MKFCTSVKKVWCSLWQKDYSNRQQFLRVLNDSPVYPHVWTQVTVVYIQKIHKEINYTTCKIYANHMIIRHCKHTNSLTSSQLSHHMCHWAPFPYFTLCTSSCIFVQKQMAVMVYMLLQTDWDLENRHGLPMDSPFLELQASVNVIRFRFTFQLGPVCLFHTFCW